MEQLFTHHAKPLEAKKSQTKLSLELMLREFYYSRKIRNWSQRIHSPRFVVGLRLLLHLLSNLVHKLNHKSILLKQNRERLSRLVFKHTLTYLYKCLKVAKRKRKTIKITKRRKKKAEEKRRRRFGKLSLINHYLNIRTT